MTESIARKAEEIWREVLTVPSGQEEATFFELGGESIAAVRLVSRVEDELDIMIDVGDIFEEDPNLTSFVGSVLAQAGQADAA